MTTNYRDDPTENVRLVTGTPIEYVQSSQRSGPQKAQDNLLDRASEVFAEAKALIEEGLECLSVLGIVSPNRNVPTLVAQLVIEADETKRLRR